MKEMDCAISTARLIIKSRVQRDERGGEFNGDLVFSRSVIKRLSYSSCSPRRGRTAGNAIDSREFETATAGTY